MVKSSGSILGISFDGLAISGIVNEFFNSADILRQLGLRVLFDPGYDITFRRDLAPQPFPGWVNELRVLGDKLPGSYCPEVVTEATSRVTNGAPIASCKTYDALCKDLTGLIVNTLLRENVRFLIVENGTLPDNPIFTESLYHAILEYGSLKRLEKYVLWRDYDLMWSAEPHFYGPYPYSGVRKPTPNRHVQYVVLTEWMKRRMQAWAPGVDYQVIPNRFYQPDLQRGKRSLRTSYSIPEDAYLIARCTRVIPQKCIERDLCLFDQIQKNLAASGDHRPIFLFITGPIEEDGQEFERLCRLEQFTSIGGQVIWGNGLLPFSPLISSSLIDADRFSIFDLLAESDLSSFLTSFDYEGFGNPPGEAMAIGVPFISTTYELYDAVYGSRGAIAPLWPIDRSSMPSDPAPDYFIDWVMRALTDEAYRPEVIRHNLEVCRKYFSIDALRIQLAQIFEVRSWLP